MYPLINLGARDIGTYGICALVGFILAVYFFYRNTRSDEFMFEDSVLLAVPVFFGMIIGGHLLYGMTNAKMLFKLMMNLNRLTFGQAVQVLGYCFGGSVFYGGFLGAWAAILLFTKKYPRKMKRYLRDTFVVSIPLFHTFARIGCFMGGCCYGIKCDFGITVYNNPLVPELNGVCRFPTPLAESAGNLMIFFFLLFIYQKRLMRGRMIYLYLLIYPCMRFGLEFLRGDTVRGFIFGLSTSQWISLILFTISASYLLFTNLLLPERKYIR